MILFRSTDWLPRLQAVVREYDGTPFVWGSADCLTFVADAVRAQTGKDPLGGHRGRYQSRIGAWARVRGCGFKTFEDLLADMLTRAGAVEADPRAVGVGDVGLTTCGAAAVRMPQGFIARQPDGRFATANVKRAWAICLK